MEILLWLNFVILKVWRKWKIVVDVGGFEIVESIYVIEKVYLSGNNLSLYMWGVWDSEV